MHLELAMFLYGGFQLVPNVNRLRHPMPEQFRRRLQSYVKVHDLHFDTSSKSVQVGVILFHVNQLHVRNVT